MKLRLPPGLLAVLIACSSFVSRADILPPDSGLVDVKDFVQLSYILDRNYSYQNPSFSTSSTLGSSLSFDGDGSHSLVFAKSESLPRYMIHLENMSDSTGSVSLNFSRLTGVSFTNEQEGTFRTKGSIYLFSVKGDSTLTFSDITGDLSWSGFVTSETGNIQVRSDSANAKASFNNITGDITFSNGRGNEQNLSSPGICVWTDSPGGYAQLDISEVTGDILFSHNVNDSLGAALCVFGFEGKSSLNISDITGDISFVESASYYGGAIYSGGMGDGTEQDAHVVFSRITGELRFSENEASSGGVMMIAGAKMDVTFSDITGDVVFENNRATGGWEPALGGAIVLDIGGASGTALLEFSHITGDLIFRNNQAGATTGTEAYGGAIFAMGGANAHLILSADKGNIFFEGNKAAFVANSIYLMTDSVVDVVAGCEYTVYFYDPVVTDPGKSSELNINKDLLDGMGEISCGGMVLFSGGKITEESLGGDASDLEERMERSKLSVINGKVTVYQGHLVVADEAVLNAFSYEVKGAGSVVTRNGGRMEVSGEQAEFILESGADFDASVVFTGDSALLTLKEGDAGSRTDIQGSFSGLRDVSLNGGSFSRYAGFGEIDNLLIKGGRLDIGRTKTTVLQDDGGTLNLVLSGPAGSSSVLDAGSVTGTFAHKWIGGDGKSLGAQVLFDLTASGQDLIGQIYPLVSLGGELQHYDFALVEGGLSGAGTGWHTYESGNILFQYSFDGSSIHISDEIQEVIGSTPDPQPGSGIVKVEIIRESTKGTVAVSLSDPTKLEFTSKDGVVTGIGTGLQMDGVLIATQDRISERDTLIHADGSREVVGNIVLRSGGINLVAGENVTLTGLGPDCGAVDNVDTLSIKSGIVFRLRETSLDIGRSLDMREGSSLIASGECSRVNVGGAVMENAGSLSDLTSASLASSSLAGAYVSFSEGASLTVSPLKLQDGSSLGSRLEVTNSVIELGFKGDGRGGSLRAEQGAELIFSASHIRGTGAVENAVFSGGSLTAGTPAGVLSIGNLVLTGGVELKSWLTGNIESSRLNTSPDSFSVFSVTGVLHISDARFSLAWDSAALGREDILAVGTGLRVFVFENENALLDGRFSSLDLPGLEGGLVWDTSQLYSQGILTVVSAGMGNGTRMANALWSSAGAVGGFAGTAVSRLNDWREHERHFWVSGLGDFSSFGNHGGLTGFDYRGGGYAVGSDYRFATGTVAGLAFGQTFGTHDPSRGNERYSPGSIKQDGIMMAVYGRQEMTRTQAGAFYVDGYFSYGSVTNKSEKGALYDGDTARAKWDDTVFSAGLKAVWETRLDDKSTLKPFVGLDYVHAGQEDFEERTASSSARYRDGRYQNWVLGIGVELNRMYDLGDGMRLMPGFTLAYKADVSRDTPSVYVADPGRDYAREDAVSPGRNGVYAAFDLRWQMSRNWMTSLGYELEARSGVTEQSVNAAVSYAF